MLKKKIKKKICGKSLTVFEVLKGGPFEQTKTFFHKMSFDCFSPFINNAFGTNSAFFFTKICT